MPRYFDPSQLRNAITAQAMPALEVLAADPNRLDRSRNTRFERDDPPPYMSSSESESEEALRHPVLARPQEAVVEDFAELLSQPLSKEESDSLVTSLIISRCYSPGTRYRSETRLEYERLSSFCMNLPYRSPLKEFLKVETGQQRRAVIVRHNIRKRWQRLGIWNPEWGIPGRVDPQPKDCIDNWRWRWQSDTDPPPYDPQHPVSRAVQLRKNLDYSERPVPPPRSRLSEDASASEAESFIISRPWFIYSLERYEFMERKERIPWQQRGRPHAGQGSQVTKWWKERGDWQKDWEVPGDRSHVVVGWKWRHESPSPEPEDLSRLLADDMDFTPSEMDALEAALTPTPPSPKFPQTNHHGPYIFGRREDAESGNQHPPQPDAVHEDDQVEPEDQLMQDAEFEPPNPPPRRRGCPRRPDQPAQVALAPQPPPRRSARIAAMAASAAPAAPAVTTSKQATKRSARAVPAAPPTRDAKPPKKRGRSRRTQDGGITKAAASQGKRGRKPSVT